jgi:hypothetical protein
VVSSNDTKPIQTNNLAPTLQAMTAALFFGVNLSDTSPSTYSKLYSVQAATHEHILMFPLLIVRSGVLRQGFDKFYSVSFQARHSFFVTFKSS